MKTSTRWGLPLVAATGLLVIASVVVASCSKPAQETKKDLELVAVSVIHPIYRDISGSFTVMGSVKAKNEVTVLSETSGKIVSLPASIGGAVTAEAPLAYVDKDLREAAFLTAEAAYKKAQKDAERASSLHGSGLVSDAEGEAAKLGEISARAQYLMAKKELENTTIRASIGGTIADTYVSKGGQVGPGTPVALIVDTSALKVRVLLPERSAIRHEKGDRVAITSDLFPGKSFAGEIDSISIRGDETHSFPSEITLLGEAAKELRSGMSVRLQFTESARKALLIPRATLLGSVREPEVFTVAKGSGYKASRRAVVVGEEYGTDIEVLSGLTEADLVVSGGQSLISDAQEVRVIDPEAAK